MTNTPTIPVNGIAFADMCFWVVFIFIEISFTFRPGLS